MRLKLKEKVDTLPTRPGVYIFYGGEKECLYVGKAVNLRSRVRSYFQSPKSLTHKVLHMVNRIEDLEFIVTDNEVEALILESNLIKRYRPIYNIRLRDDKHYPYLKVTTDEEWPRVIITRSIKNDGGRYFGPYTHSGALNETLRAIRRAFPYRVCSNYRLERGGRPCLEYHIGRCLAPCDDRTTPEEYSAMIEDLCAFLEGRDATVLKDIEAQMYAAAEALDFERAAELRDRLRALSHVQAKQKIISGRLEDQDLVGLAEKDGRRCVQVFFVREGRVVGREHFMLEEPDGDMPGGEHGDGDAHGGAVQDDPGEVLAAFIKQYYADAAFIPREVLVSHVLPDDEEGAIVDWLSQRRGTRVFLRRPQRGEKRRLMALVVDNARLLLEQEEAQRTRRGEDRQRAMEDLAASLGMETFPRRIECYDISNLHGTNATGAMVVFQEGQPDKSGYRRFNIRTVSGSDDYAMMQEVIFRRFRRAVQGDEKFGTVPDLILVDGGRGQLNAALEVLQSLNLDHLPLAALAERREVLYSPREDHPIVLPEHSPALHLVQRIRDEAHRFALTQHRRLRRSSTVRSILEDIPGIGPRRRRELLKHFGSIDAIRRATVEEIARVKSMNMGAARAVKDRL